VRRQRRSYSSWKLFLLLNIWWGNQQLLVAYGSDEVKVQTTILCDLSNIIYPGGHVTRLSSKMAVHWKIPDDENDGLQMAFQYIGGQAWVGVGFSSTSQGNMLGSRAIVGVPGKDPSSNSTVQVYQLMSKQPQDASAIVQNPDFTASHKVGGYVEMKSKETIMHFSLQGLADFQRPDDQHLYTIIYALGQSTSLGMHTHQGAFRLNLQFCGGRVPSPTKSSPTATRSPSLQPPTSPDSPIPATEPAGDAPSGTDESSQTPEPSQSPVEAQETIEPNPSNSSDDKDSGSMATSYDHKTAFAAHGFLATISFAVLVPTAMASAWFRSLMPKWWIYVHVLSNCTGFFFGVLSVVVAFSGVVLRGTSSGDPISHLSLTHHRTGLVLVLLAAAQVASGFCRPPVQLSDDRNDDDGDNDSVDSDGYNRICGWTSKVPWWGDLSRREKWHWLHRGVAITMIGLAIYQLTSGANLYSQEYQGGQRTTVVAMWVWLACVAASLICLRLYLLTRAEGGTNADPSTAGAKGLHGHTSTSPASTERASESRSGAAGGVWRSPPARAFSSHKLERRTRRCATKTTTTTSSRTLNRWNSATPSSNPSPTSFDKGRDDLRFTNVI
jgi:Eukaryotic cytochrome b561